MGFSPWIKGLAKTAGADFTVKTQNLLPTELNKNFINIKRQYQT